MYFERCGKVNTQMSVELALKAAVDNGVNYIVVASNEGETAKLLENCEVNVVVVTHVNGFKEVGVQ